MVTLNFLSMWVKPCICECRSQTPGLRCVRSFARVRTLLNSSQVKRHKSRPSRLGSRQSFNQSVPRKLLVRRVPHIYQWTTLKPIKEATPPNYKMHTKMLITLIASIAQVVTVLSIPGESRTLTEIVANAEAETSVEIPSQDGSVDVAELW